MHTPARYAEKMKSAVLLLRYHGHGALAFAIKSDDAAAIDAVIGWL